MAQDIVSERLVAALRAAGAPAKMIQLAGWGYYADWLATYPVSQFERDATAAGGLASLVARWKAGEFRG